MSKTKFSESKCFFFGADTESFHCEFNTQNSLCQLLRGKKEIQGIYKKKIPSYTEFNNFNMSAPVWSSSLQCLILRKQEQKEKQERSRELLRSSWPLLVIVHWETPVALEEEISPTQLLKHLLQLSRRRHLGDVISNTFF